MGIYYTNKNQISKKEISSDFNINQSNQQPFDAETSNPDGYDAIEIYKQVINEKICYDSLMHDFSDPECKFPGSAEVLTEIRDRS